MWKCRHFIIKINTAILNWIFAVIFRQKQFCSITACTFLFVHFIYYCYDIKASSFLHDTKYR